jgi:hypothetical protein
MGAWGTGVFENDDALDWCGEFLDAPSGAGSRRSPGKDALVTAALQRAADKDEGYEADAASAGLAAAEVVAALAGRPGPELSAADEDSTPGEVAAWARDRGSDALQQPQVRALAAQAVRRALDGSELAELWEEAEHAAAWRAAVEDLLRRLPD